MNEIRKQLKNCQPYFIEHELLPKIYFKEDNNKTEYWIFFYSFIRRLSDEAIGIRLGYDSSTIYRKTFKIIKNNLRIITDFLDNTNNNMQK